MEFRQAKYVGNVHYDEVQARWTGDLRLRMDFDHQAKQAVFSGGIFGEHRVDLLDDSGAVDRKRIDAHWNGYVEVNEQEWTKRNAKVG